MGSDGTVIPQPDSFACRLELDINSVPSNVPLPKQGLPLLFKEFVRLAKEIATNGDIS